MRFINILRCVGFCLYSSFYMWSRLDHYSSNVYQQDHLSSCLLKQFAFSGTDSLKAELSKLNISENDDITQLISVMEIHVKKITLKNNTDK